MTPDLEEIRAVCQPEVLVTDLSREHWMGRLYMRRVSLHLTRLVAGTRATPNSLTWGMVAAGLAAAVVLTIPSPWAIMGAVVLIQVQVLLDCSDGELARWRGTSSIKGVYLDQIGHHTTDPALIAAVGVHADGGLGAIGGWTTLSLAAALLSLVVRAETDLVLVARYRGKLPAMEPAAITPRATGIRRIRRVVYRLPINRLLLGWDLTVVLIAVAIVDAVDHSRRADEVLTLALVAVAAIVSIGHFLTIWTSDRLR